MLQKQGPLLILCRHEQICYYVKANISKKKGNDYEILSLDSKVSVLPFCFVLFCFVAIDKYSVSIPGQIIRKTGIVSGGFSPLLPALHLARMALWTTTSGGPQLHKLTPNIPPHYCPTFNMHPEYLTSSQFSDCSHARKAREALWKHELPSLPGVIYIAMDSFYKESSFPLCPGALLGAEM